MINSKHRAKIDYTMSRIVKHWEVSTNSAIEAATWLIEKEEKIIKTNFLRNFCF